MKKILYINQETAPYVPETTMSVMGRDLPQKMQEQGNEIRIFMPKWGMINERRGQLHEVIRLSGMNLIVDDTDHPLIIKVASIPASRLQVYFIDNEDFFYKRGMSTNADGEEYDDNGERAIFFARGVLETVKKLRWAPDVIHCQGWISALVPYYLRTIFKSEPTFQNTKIVTSLYENQLTKDFKDNFLSIIDYKTTKNPLAKKYAKPFTCTELGKLAIDYSDGVVCANSQASAELQEHAKAKNLPLLPYAGDDCAEAYLKFYETL